MSIMATTETVAERALNNTLLKAAYFVLSVVVTTIAVPTGSWGIVKLVAIDKAVDRLEIARQSSAEAIKTIERRTDDDRKETRTLVESNARIEQALANLNKAVDRLVQRDDARQH